MKRNAHNIALQTEYCEYATYIKKEDIDIYNVRPGTFLTRFWAMKKNPKQLLCAKSIKKLS